MKNNIQRWLARLMAAAMVLSLVPGMAFAATAPVNNPFGVGTLGSTYWRIPAMVTVDDGTVVAAADARWGHGSDAGDIDVLVSISKDNGATWTTPKYALTAEGDKATFMDAALATDGETIYMVADVYPAGVAIVGGDKYPSKYKAFDSNGNLLLAEKGSSSYNYYLSEGEIHAKDGTVVEGYTVDSKFNLLQNGTVVSNLFYSDAAYQVVPTTFLCMSKSTDGGETWSDYTLLNVKNSGEAFYGVGPGSGVVTDDGRVVFACYSHNKGTFSYTEHTSFIYSDDGGKTWSRTKNMSSQGSEAALTEADGKLYAFSRTSNSDEDTLTYYVSTDNGTKWSEVTNSDVNPNTSCQMNAITYSKTINGKTAILLSCPAGKKSLIGSDNGRKNGKIFVGLVNEDGTLDFRSIASTEINGSNDFFAYSCLTELKDGSVGILYECDASGTDGIVYRTYTAAELFDDAAIGGGETGGDNIGDGETTTPEDTTVTDPDAKTGVTVTGPGLVSATIEKLTSARPWSGYTHAVGYSIDLEDANGEYTGAATVKIPYNEDDFKGCNSFIGSVGDESFAVSAPVDGYFTLEVPHFSDVTVSGREVTPQIVGGVNTYAQYDHDNNGLTNKIDDPDSAGYKKNITRLIVSSGTSYNLQLDATVKDAQWSTPTEGGIALTSSADNQSCTLVGSNSSATPIETTVSVTAADGTHIDTIDVMVVNTGATTSGPLITYYIQEITDTTVYMSLIKQENNELLNMAVQAGDVFYLRMEKPTGGIVEIPFVGPVNTLEKGYTVNFFGAPEKGYALTYMHSNPGQENYFALDGEIAGATSFYTDQAKGYVDDGVCSAEKMQAVIKGAMDKKCDGALLWCSDLRSCPLSPRK